MRNASCRNKRKRGESILLEERGVDLDGLFDPLFTTNNCTENVVDINSDDLSQWLDEHEDFCCTKNPKDRSGNCFQLGCCVFDAKFSPKGDGENEVPETSTKDRRSGTRSTKRARVRQKPCESDDAESNENTSSNAPKEFSRQVKMTSTFSMGNINGYNDPYCKALKSLFFSMKRSELSRSILLSLRL